jgi:hypothetical protein
MKDCPGNGIGVHHHPLKEFPQFLYRKHPFLIHASPGHLPRCLRSADEGSSQDRLLVWFADRYYCLLSEPSRQRVHLNTPPCLLERSPTSCDLHQGLLVFMLLQTSGPARQLMFYLHPRLSVPLPKKDYASDCRVFTPEDSESLSATSKTSSGTATSLHFLGWYVKMLIIRDVRLC